MKIRKKDVDDVHFFDNSFKRAVELFKETDRAANVELMNKFIASCRRSGIRKSTVLSYVNIGKRLVEVMDEVGLEKDIHEIDQYDFDTVLLYLEDEIKLKQGTIRNYKKFIKKYFGWYIDDNPLNIPDHAKNMKWIRKLRLEPIESTVQPHEVLTSEELDKMLSVCSNNPRNRALIAVLADSGMRIGALGSCRLQHVELNDIGAMIYISRTSRSKKTAEPRGIPLTWSTGYLEHWLASHPLKNDPEAPLWVNLNLNHGPMGYSMLWKTLERIGAKAGIKKRVNPHSFRHFAIISWILDGLTEQEIKHRAGWSRGSTRIFEVYANYTDRQINEGIYAKYGLITHKERQIKLDKCPRCNTILRPTEKACSQCSLLLSSRVHRGIKEHGSIIVGEIMRLVLEYDDQGRYVENNKSNQVYDMIENRFV